MGENLGQRGQLALNKEHLGKESPPCPESEVSHSMPLALGVRRQLSSFWASFCSTVVQCRIYSRTFRTTRLEGSQLKPPAWLPGALTMVPLPGWVQTLCGSLHASPASASLWPCRESGSMAGSVETMVTFSQQCHWVGRATLCYLKGDEPDPGK